MVNETDKAYAAGLFDGEGSVGISWRVQSKKSTMLTYSTRASISMMDEDSILWLTATFGGHYDTTTKNKLGKPIHRWTLHCRKAADFLELILPYLKLKRTRAEAAIKLARMKRERGALSGHEGMHRMTQVEVDAQRPLAEFIRAENLRQNPRIASFSTWGVQ